MATKKIRPELALIASNLENLLKRWELTQQEFANLFTDTDRATVSNWTRAHSAPRVEQLMKICQMCGKSVEQLYSTYIDVSEFPSRPLTGEMPTIEIGTGRMTPLFNDLGLRYELQKIWDRLDEIQERLDHLSADN